MNLNDITPALLTGFMTGLVTLANALALAVQAHPVLAGLLSAAVVVRLTGRIQRLFR